MTRPGAHAVGGGRGRTGGSTQKKGPKPRALRERTGPGLTQGRAALPTAPAAALARCRAPSARHEDHPGRRARDQATAPGARDASAPDHDHPREPEGAAPRPTGTGTTDRQPQDDSRERRTQRPAPRTDEPRASTHNAPPDAPRSSPSAAPAPRTSNPRPPGTQPRDSRAARAGGAEAGRCRHSHRAGHVTPAGRGPSEASHPRTGFAPGRRACRGGRRGRRRAGTASGDRTAWPAGGEGEGGEPQASPNATGNGGPRARRAKPPGAPEKGWEVEG